MNTEYRKLKNLFLRQSCQDAWEDYARSIRKVNFSRWDYVILTSSNEEQARSFRSQIADRLEQGVLPGWTKYFVLPDPEGKRVGSGGATLNVLRFLSEEEGLRGDFHNKRILVIHSGGDSKRVPQYSVCGKLFSPVPRELPDGRGSTLFDEFLISMAGVPARFKEGMLVLSGDVLLLFNPLQIDAQFRGAAAISMKSPVEVGVDHGVFLNNGSDHVKMFLHKQPAETLRRLGAVNGQDCVDLDTGAVLLDAEILETLFSLIADASGKKADPDKYESFVNEKARVSFYGDFLYPLAADSTFEQYQKEKPEGEFCTELFTCREKIWKGVSSACFGDASMFSFHATKVFNTIEGGAVCFKNDSWVQLLNDQKNFGIHGPESVCFVGGNAKMNEFQAAMGICNLRHLNDEIAKRKKVVERYRERLSGVEGIQLSAVQENVESNYAYFPVVFDGYKYTRNEVYEMLSEQGITARKYFYPLTNSFECYRNYPTAGTEKTPVAQHLALRVLTLPLYADIALEDVDRICNIILG